MVVEETSGRSTKAGAKPTLLAGGNPQIAKGDGNTPVQAYIEAMPGWKRDIGRRLDALISANVPSGVSLNQCQGVSEDSAYLARTQTEGAPSAVLQGLRTQPGASRAGEARQSFGRRTTCVRKAVRWNSPFYGSEGQGWFLSFRCLTRYIKVAFFAGASLRPVPPVESKNEGTRYFHVHEGDQLDEELVASWIRQASQLPGWAGFGR